MMDDVVEQKQCFCCLKLLELDATSNDLTSIGMLDDGLIFRATGNFGSTVFDPPGYEVLEMYVCDKCVIARADLITYMKQKPNAALYRGVWVLEDGSRV